MDGMDQGDFVDRVDKGDQSDGRTMVSFGLCIRALFML